jgi:hypothetical protein
LVLDAEAAIHLQVEPEAPDPQPFVTFATFCSNSVGIGREGGDPPPVAGSARFPTLCYLCDLLFKFSSFAFVIVLFL